MNQKGVALISVFMVIVVMAILGASLLGRGAVEAVSMQSFSNDVHAFWLAEAGLQRAVWELNNGGGTWAGWATAGSTKTLSTSWGSSGEFDIIVDGYSGLSPVVTVTGYYPSKTSARLSIRSVQAEAQKSGSIFRYAAFSNGELTMSGQAYTDGYDSSQGAYGGTNISSDGDAGTNDDINIGGNAYIDGDASTGPSGSFSDPTYVSGNIEHDNNETLPVVTVPAYLTALADGGGISGSTTLASGNYKFWYINLSSKSVVNITGPADIYLTGSTSISVSGQAAIEIDAASTGPVNIYFDGDVSLTGQGITNTTGTPSNLFLYGTGASQEVKLAGQGDFYGAIYAPTAALKLTGQGSLFGSFIGEEVTISGQGGVHYDTQLGNLGAASSPFTVSSWKDLSEPYPLY
ncbi:MAG: collagen-binding domain-containing protein [Candidatus Omnitrophota bacterium]